MQTATKFVAVLALAVSRVQPATASTTTAETIRPVSNAELQQAKKQRNRPKPTAKQIAGSIDPNIKASKAVGPSAARLGLGYRYDISPSYQSGLYTRLDRWQLDTRLKPLEAMKLVSDSPLMPGLKLVPGSEIVVVRQFKSKKEALGAAPQAKLKSLPLSAENAQKMEAGSILMFTVKAEDLKGIDGSVNILGPLAVGGHAGHVDRGTFQIQAQKLEGDKLRLRVVSTRQHVFEGKISLKLKVGPLKTKLASTSKSKGPQSLVSVEYEFDLNNPEARRAYDNIFKEGALTPSLRLANPFMSTEASAHEMNEGMTEVQTLAAADGHLPKGMRRVSQSYQAVSTSNPLRSKHGFNLLKLASFEKSTSVASKNHLSYVDEAGLRHETPATTYESRKQTRRLFGLRNEQEIRRASYISETDEEGLLTGDGEYVVTHELKDKRMGKSETEKVREKLRRLIAPSILKKLQIDPILTSTAYKNARVYTQVILSNKAFKWLRGQTVDQLEASLTSYLISRNERTAERPRAIRKTAELLEKALDASTSEETRLEIFGDLQKESLFRDTGSGYLMSLLPESQLEDLVSVFIRVDATAFEKPVLASFGHSDFTQIAKTTECADYQQNRTAIDLRLEDVCATSTDITTTQVGPSSHGSALQ